jgi:hypothetical protein
MKCAAEDGKSAAEVFKEAIMGKTDALAGEGDALAELEHVACIFPRGRYDLSIFPSFMVMDGQNSQFKIRCLPPDVPLHLSACFTTQSKGSQQSRYPVNAVPDQTAVEKFTTPLPHSTSIITRGAL